MPRNTTIDSIIQSGNVLKEFRILTTSLQWPEGEPPFSAGEYLQVSSLETPTVYNPAAFVANDWTDVTSLVTAYSYNDSINNQVGALSLTVPMGLSSRDLDRCFNSMRVIRVQEKYSSLSDTTDWLDVCFCISTGYNTSFSNNGQQIWTVNALDVLMLAGLDILGDAVYQADVIIHGTLTTNYDMALVGNFPDAWEFGIVDGAFGTASTADATKIIDASASFTSRLIGRPATVILANGQFETAVVSAVTSSTQLALSPGFPSSSVNVRYYVGAVQPNWSDKPGVQFWSHDTPGETTPTPLAIAGDAIQAVFGEGIFRLSKNYCITSPGTNKDFKLGLGYAEGVIPDVRCIVGRFAHPSITDRHSVLCISDIFNYTSANETTVGYIKFTSTDTLYNGLTVILNDGTGRRLKTSTVENITGNVWKANFTNSSESISPNTPFTYGDGNKATTVITRLLVESGFQQAASTKPFYINTPETPIVGEETIDIVLPPLVSKEEDGKTRLYELEDLKKSNAIVPSWITRSKADGEIYIENIKQKLDADEDANSDVLILDHVSTAEIDRTDMNVFTKVIVYGQPRQLQDATQVLNDDTYASSILDVAEVDGGLPAVNESNSEVVVDSTTYTLDGWCSRIYNSGTIYKVLLSSLFDRSRQILTSSWLERPWTWYVDSKNYAGGSSNLTTEQFNVMRDAFRNAWSNKQLCEIIFKNDAGVETEIEINRLVLNTQNHWGFDSTDYNRGQYTTIEQQILDVYYYDSADETYKLLAGNIYCNISPTDQILHELTDKDFVTRQTTNTSRLKIVCAKPFLAQHTSFEKDDDLITWYYRYYLTIGCYLSAVEVWPVEKLKETAEIGVTEPFTGARWEAIRNRFRKRTYVVKEVADWANTESLLQGLAKEWLYEVTRNLSPRSINTFRPDVTAGDTVRFMLPTGEVNVFGDSLGQITQLYLYGLKSTNTADGMLYWTIDTGVLYLYKDVLRAELVAHSSGVVIIQDNFSGIEGLVTLDYSEVDTGSLAIPTYLVISADKSGNFDAGTEQKLTVINYTDPYFEG